MGSHRCTIWVIKGRLQQTGVNIEPTEQQTAEGQSTSKKLSMQATAPPANVPGYRLTQFLGAGAFGQVWVGRDLNTGRDVAVKFYLHRGGVNWSLLSREVKNLVQLSADRYVVQVLEVGWDAEPPYYVMELISGGSLEELLQTRGRLPRDEAVEMFRRICIGLNRCHAKGVLHCDLKPANILLGGENEPRLADFGQSRLSDDQTPALGTLFYMAPEQAHLNAAPDASWDVYAVGAIFYRLLTGQPPYRADDVVEQLDTAGSLEKRLKRYRDLIHGSPPPTRHLQRHDVDRMLGRIVSRCLAPDPRDRYGNVQQILQDLNRRETARAKRPLLLLGIVGPLLVLLATCVFAARSIRQASQRTVNALRQEAFSSNELAAAFAARTLESEIERYYQVTRDEASRQELVSELRAALQDDEVRDALQAIAAKGTPLVTQGVSRAREQLLDSPFHDRLEQILSRRLALYGKGNRRRLASMFVVDPLGTILSIAYDEPVTRDEDSSGRNFCYRTYFHGGRTDLPRDTTAIGSVEQLKTTHMSAAFPSTATRQWKVAISTPIFLSEDRSRPNAMFVVTVNLGDFELLQSKQGQNQVAALVEARPGPTQGTILQHPWMELRREAGENMEGEKYQILPDLMNRLLAGRDVDYTDPLAGAEGGEPYSGQWIAAMQPVSLPAPLRPDDDSTVAGSAERPIPDELDTTDLLVLVQYRLEKVIAPVAGMRSALLWEGAAAVGSILFVTLSLWLVVRRVSTTTSDRGDERNPSRHFADTITVR